MDFFLQSKKKLNCGATDELSIICAFVLLTTLSVAEVVQKSRSQMVNLTCVPVLSTIW